jgi:xylose isomerase
MDICARGLKAAAAMIEDGALGQFVEDRYAGWNTPDGEAMLKGIYDLDQIAAKVGEKAINPKPRSGKQEYLENLVNRFV